MNHRHRRSTRTTQRPARQSALERLDEAIDRNGGAGDNTEKIKLMRRLYFADVDAYMASGQFVLPK